MKTYNLINKVIVVLFITIQTTVNAQNQSMFLPFSGDTYPSTGSKMINFTNNSITTLPRHAFSYQGNTGDPHNEIDLQALGTNPNNFLFNEEYLGQHPMFAQSVVHDNDGNLLFFIVDNNIYNRHGVAFTLCENGFLQYGTYTYLFGDVNGK